MKPAFGVLFLLLLGFAAVPAQAMPASVQTSWRLLDYIAVDYKEAVQDERIVNDAEYQEMVEFSRSARERIASLPDHPAKQDLEREARALESLIARQSAPEEVARSARSLASALIAAYPVPVAPASLLEPGRSAALYQSQCASCHGATGAGDGPLASNMEPPPIDFTDRARARERSIFALYQVITQGLEGTAMASFAHLTPEERWGLAFRIGSMAFSPEQVEAGRRIWQSRDGIRARIDMEKLVGATTADFEREFGAGEGAALMAFLRTHPDLLLRNDAGALDEVRDQVREAVRAYAAGNAGAARDLAMAAYLEGFEPVEPQLAVRDGDLVRRVEAAMTELRSLIAAGAPQPEIEAKAQTVLALLDEAQGLLDSSEGSWWTTFLGALAVLLREGLEALLLVAAFIALLRKSERTEFLPYVHGGWITAIGAGVLTWFAATTLLTISGAARELIEGFGALTAAAVLVWVGLWMHGRSRGTAWQQEMKERMGRALSGGSAWYLFGLVFLVVYREAFETILFYIALLQQGSGLAVILGGASAVALLALAAIAVAKVSRNLPIGKFFAWSSFLMAGLAVILTGKGVAALQEAGLLPITSSALPVRLELLGVYPTVEGLAAQAAVILLLAIIFLRQNSEAREAPAG